MLAAVLLLACHRKPASDDDLEIDAAPPTPSGVDDTFASYAKGLPAPATLSEGNGASIPCTDGDATLTLLDAAAAKVPIHGDADLALVVPWARNADPCIRQIAMSVIASRTGFVPNDLSVPDMSTPDRRLYHRILTRLKKQLDERHVAYEPAAFAGLEIGVDQAEIVKLLQGQWAEADTGHLNFLERMELAGDTIRVTQHEVHDDPQWPEYTYATHVTDLHLNDEGQLVVTGDFTIESQKGKAVTRKTKANGPILLWLVAPDIVWLGQSQSQWNELRRVK
ncbi:MAG TPA: hypothetical protein VF407_10315 [Polyangiaceae bacterium]